MSTEIVLTLKSFIQRWKEVDQLHPTDIVLDQIGGDIKMLSNWLDSVEKSAVMTLQGTLEMSAQITDLTNAVAREQETNKALVNQNMELRRDLEDTTMVLRSGEVKQDPLGFAANTMHTNKKLQADNEAMKADCIKGGYEYAKLRAENERLKYEIATLNKHVDRYNAMEDENKRLNESNKRLLDEQNKASERIAAANRFSENVGNIFSNIDKRIVGAIQHYKQTLDQIDNIE